VREETICPLLGCETEELSEGLLVRRFDCHAKESGLYSLNVGKLHLNFGQ
jgi:hypothetical protein